MKQTSFLRTMKPGLLTLTLGGIVVGMTEFMMMGVLPDVATSLSVSIPKAGYLIAIYALGVVIGAPLMTALTSHYKPRIVLMGMMGMFALFNTLFALAPSYGLLLVARLFAGLPHGAFFGMGAVVAARLAEPGREARAVSMMFAGLTIANIAGVPLGTWMSHEFGWRYAFFTIAVIAVIAAFSIYKWMPNLAPSQSEGFGKSLRVFRQKDFWLIIGISSIGTGGLFAWISYIAPLMTEVAGFGAASVSSIMIIAGVGMAVGNFMGGRLADRFSPLKTTGSLLLTMIAALLIVSVVSYYKAPALVMTFVTGAIAFAVIAPMQMLMISSAKGAEMLASSVLQASANMGNALGAYLGGLPIAAGLGYTSPEYVGAGLALTGFILCMVLAKVKKQPAVVPNQETVKAIQSPVKEKNYENIYQ
ncbi:MFS transporter [Paraflavitalea sp. CAU 1676]|uniref:MFS transporter n=1 Tax=Paraflavitalea sp. CAU 1676 TaxID=3032598 RepID=UPI0023DC2DD6|nr:MFS transporter [Paraflavitalea sp. CAU 1676]MDF2193259.1 MFS transporter [Paraflavitalea sp. CAU 1676]